MRRVVAFALVSAALSAAGAAAGPPTKQNGSDPVFTEFTSICTLDGFASYGWCAGDTTKFTDVTGRINAVQPKPGKWSLELNFANLDPGRTYALWGNQTGLTPTPGFVTGFFEVGTTVADSFGNARFSYETTDPSDLGFDLNTVGPGHTVVTSWWSSQWLQVNPDGTLFVGS